MKTSKLCPKCGDCLDFSDYHTWTLTKCVSCDYEVEEDLRTDKQKRSDHDFDRGFHGE